MKIKILILLAIISQSTFSQVDPKNITIVRDNFGVPHIYGKTDKEAAYGLAWAHSEDDFESIQYQLLAGKNMLGEVLGKEGVLFDYGLQFLGIDTFVDRVYQQEISEHYKQILMAFCQGVNDCANAHPDDILLKKSLPFAPKDIIKSFTLNLSLMAGVGMALKGLREGRVEEYFAPNETGSNAFAIAPSRTEDNKTWLCGNSHQPLEGRFGWYEAHIVSEEGWDIMGGLFAGGTSIFVGANKHLGWAHTTNYNTWGDIYKLTLNKKNKNQYEYDGKWHNFKTSKAKLKVKLGGLKLALSKKLMFTEYGPVFKSKQGLFAIRFPAYRNIKAAEQWYNMNKARNWKEFEAAIKMEGVTHFNIVYGDEDGTIFYQSNGAIPKRDPNLGWHTPISSTSARYKWTELLSFDEKPTILNPDCGYVFNANNTPLEATGKSCNTTCNFPGIQRFMYNRGERFKSFFESKSEKYTWDDILKFKFDKSYHPNGTYRDRFKNLYQLSSSKYPDIASSIAKLNNWNLECGVENKDAALAMITHYFLFKESKLPFGFLMIREKPITEDLAVKCVRKASSLLTKHYGSIDVKLGEVQRHIRGNVSIPASGGFEVPRAADATLYNKKKGVFKVKSGDGFIQFAKFEKGKLPEILSINAYGASAHSDSKHFTDQMQKFQDEKFKLMTFDKNEIFKNAEVIYKPGEIRYR